MNKAILFILAGFFSLIIAIPMHVPLAQAESTTSMDDGMMRKKRYRYRNRTHRVQIGVNAVPWSEDRDKSLFIDFDLLYGYNAGHFELGPNVGLSNEGRGKIKLNLKAGAWAEWNIIKNTRKEKFVPSVGLKVNYLKMSNDNDLLVAPYLSLKYFPASRTGLILNLNYDIVTPFNKLFKDREMGIGVSLAYAHYFHF